MSFEWTNKIDGVDDVAADGDVDAGAEAVSIKSLVPWRGCRVCPSSARINGDFRLMP